jgi:Protein kinase domain
MLMLGAVHLLLGVAGAVFGQGFGGQVDVRWMLAAMATFGAAAIWLTWGGSHDPRALYLAGVFVAIASAFAYLPAERLQSLGSWWTAQPWWNAVLVEPFLPLCLWLFVRTFPRVLHLDRSDAVIRAGIGTTAMVGVALFLLNLIRGLGGPRFADLGAELGASSRGPESFLYWGVILAVAAPALPVLFLRARAAVPSERQRVRRFALGLAVGLGPLLLELLAESLLPPFRRFMDGHTARLVGSLVLFPPLLSIPFFTAHAVVADRLLDVRVILGRASRYLLARTTLGLLTAVPIAGLALYLYQRRVQPLAALVSGPEGLSLLGAGAAGLLLLGSRGWLVRRLDALFDRSRLDWPRIRLRVGEAMRRAQTTREAAEALLGELERELQTETAALLGAARDQRWFVSIAGLARPLSGDSALSALALAEPSPLSVDPADSTSVFPLLPPEDQRWVVDTRTVLLVPLAGADARVTALLALGARRSEAAFTENERWEVAGVGQTAALALENRGLQEALLVAAPNAEEQELPATECPACGRVHPTEQERCSCDAPLVAAPLPRVLLGKLELQERLGEGGMGLVYRAFDRELERDVALKTLPRASEEATRRLRQEARSMAAVSHPGVAAIYGVESWQGLPILVVEHLPGGTLARRLSARWPVEKALRLALELTDPLEAIHRRGLLHGDIKPSNIGFDAEQRPKLLDFGLARIVEPLADDGAARPSRARSRTTQADVSTAVTRGVGGTPLYLCPEVLDGAPPGPQQDLWSLMLVLFELIAGAHPFRSARLEDTIDLIAHRPLPDVRRWAPACPEAVTLALAEALQRDPRKRPRSAADLALVLRELLDHLP